MPTEAPTLSTLYVDLAHLTDKGTLHSYVDLYERELAPLRSRPARVVELGVDRGGSLALWARYFSHPDARIVGVDHADVSAAVAEATHSDPRVSTVLADAVSPELVNTIGSADLIIDDASHHTSDQIASFLRLFPLVRPGGLYVIEDVQHAGDIPQFKRLWPAIEVNDLRHVKGRADDVLLIARAPVPPAVALPAAKV